MNNSIQILKLAFLLGSFCNILGWVESASLGKSSQGNSEVVNASSFMRKRRMMLGMGFLETSPSNMRSYLGSEPEHSWLFEKRHTDKKSNSGTTTQPWVKESAIVLKKGKRSQGARFQQRGTSSRALDSSALESKIVLSNGKRSEVTSYPKLRISPRVSDSSALQSKIVLSNGKRSKVVTSPDQRGISQSKIVLSKNQRTGVASSQGGGISSQLQSKIVLPNGQRSDLASSPKHGTTSRASDSSKIRSKIVLPNSKRSEVASFSPISRPGSALWRRGDTSSKNTAASKISPIESLIVLGAQSKRSKIMAPSPYGSAESIVSERSKRSEIITPASTSPTASAGKEKTKRHELGLIPENFAKPLPIYEMFDI